MGQYFIVVNDDLEELISPVLLSDGSKSPYEVPGEFSKTLTLLFELLRRYGTLGLWAGHRIRIVGDSEYDMYSSLRKNYKDVTKVMAEHLWGTLEEINQEKFYAIVQWNCPKCGALLLKPSKVNPICDKCKVEGVPGATNVVCVPPRTS